MAASDKVTVPFDTVFGFLGKQYMKTQDEYDKTLSKFYRKVVNHETALPVNPEGDVILYKDEWKEPKGVFKVLEEADQDTDGTVYLANWTDDMGNKYYTCILKSDDRDDDADDASSLSGGGIAEVVTRTAPLKDLSNVRPEIFDDHWHVVRLIKEDGSYDFVWESSPQDTMEFMEMYCTWVTRYGEWQPSSEDEGSSDDESASEKDLSDNESSDTGSDHEDSTSDDDSSDDEEEHVK